MFGFIIQKLKYREDKKILNILLKYTRRIIF